MAIKKAAKKPKPKKLAKARKIGGVKSLAIKWQT